jgi:hypothetical protein
MLYINAVLKKQMKIFTVAGAALDFNQASRLPYTSHIN